MSFKDLHSNFDHFIEMAFLYESNDDQEKSKSIRKKEIDLSIISEYNTIIPSKFDFN